MFGFYFYSFTVTFEINSVCYIRVSFPYSVVYFALPSLYPCLLINSVPICFTTFYQKRQTKIYATSISNVFVKCASHVVVVVVVVFFFSTLGAFTIESHHRNENVIKIIKLD